MSYFELLNEKRIAEADAARVASIPKYLYKFVALSEDGKKNERKFKTLFDQQVRFSKPVLLNDPYEFQGMIIDKEVLRSHSYPEEVIDFFHVLLNEQAENYAILSLSANAIDNIPMWAYYANDYHGFCVEYTVNDPRLFYEVQYVSNRMAINSIITNLYRSVMLLKSGDKSAKTDFEFYSRIVLQQFCIKHESWQHEKEYRATIPCKDPKGININLSDVGLSTNRIIAGINCSPEHIDRLNQISNHLGCGNVLQTQIHETSYTLLTDTKTNVSADNKDEEAAHD